jgi:hypothetical protein
MEAMSDGQQRLRAAEDLIDRLLPYPAPPADFAQRVLGAADAAAAAGAPVSARRRRPRLFWAASSALAVALVALVLALARRDAARAGASDILAERRETLVIGGRVTAVLEPQADIGWQDEGGRLRIDQRQGEVFYRVDRGPGSLLVATPAGDVLVTGTCFRVALQGRAGQRSTLVEVLEGAVEARTDAGRVRLQAGEWSRLVPGGVPVPLARELARAPGGGLGAAGARALALRGEAAARAGGEARAGATADAAPRPRAKVFPLTGDERLALARACKFKWALPRQISRGATMDLERVVALTPEQRAAVGRAIEEHRTQHVEALRALYAEVTGDHHTARTLGGMALHHEIDSKSPSADGVDARRLILEEWAGDAAPPADLAGRPAIERFWRLQTGALDALARRLTPIVGRERAETITAATIDGVVVGDEPGCPSGPPASAAP